MKRSGGFTWVEMLFAIVLVSVLAVFAWAGLRKALVRDGCPQVISNMKQLHLAAQSLALDGSAENPPHAYWPGDMGGSFSNWAAKIVPAYLDTNDFCKLLSLTGRITPPGRVPTENTNAILIYQIREDSTARSFS